MQSEHTMSAIEEDAFKAPQFFHWKPGERKAIKAAAHRKDRRAARRDALITTIEERAATLPPGPI